MKKLFLFTILFIGISTAQGQPQSNEKSVVPVIVILGDAGLMELGMLSKGR